MDWPPNEPIGGTLQRNVYKMVESSRIGRIGRKKLIRVSNGRHNPTYNFPDPGPEQWGLKTGRDDCGLKCSKVQMYDPNQDHCFSDDNNYDKFCWYGGYGTPDPVGQWTQVTGVAYNDNCGAQCTKICILWYKGGRECHQYAWN